MDLSVKLEITNTFILALYTIFTLVIMITAIVATNSWKKEIKAKKRKELADKLLEYVEFTEYLLVPTEEMDYPSAIYHKTLEKFGVNCQDGKQRLRKIWIELDILKQEYCYLENKEIENILGEIEKAIQKRLKDEEINKNILSEKIETIKKICAKENKAFYS